MDFHSVLTPSEVMTYEHAISTSGSRVSRQDSLGLHTTMMVTAAESSFRKHPRRPLRLRSLWTPPPVWLLAPVAASMAVVLRQAP